jgi:hypothetical protein
MDNDDYQKKVQNAVESLATLQSHNGLPNALAKSLKELLELLAIIIKYQEFDLEATRRERDMFIWKLSEVMDEGDQNDAPEIGDLP